MSSLDNLRKAAKRWLRALRANDTAAAARLRRALPGAPAQPGLRDVQHALARELGFENWNALRQAQGVPDARRSATLAADVLAAYQSGDADAIDRLQRRYGRTFTLDQLRIGIDRRLEALAADERPAGHFALAHARMLVAREHGFDSWSVLETSTAATPPFADAAAGTGVPAVVPGDRTARMIQPIEMCTSLPVRLHDAITTTTEVWAMLSACREGDLERVRAFVTASPALVRCDYNYMSPLHLAVREGHRKLVRYLAEQGAANPNYVTYPYRETLVTLALDRRDTELATYLEECYRTGDHSRPEDEGGEIDYGMDDLARRFQKLLNTNAVDEIESILKERPALALNPLTFWGEGVLMMPAKLGHRKVIDLLMRHGARVPDVSKWGAWYYLWTYDLAAHLLAHGMNANHMNCHHTTVLHDMAYTGDVRKAALLIAHGADVNAIDQEFKSTPLGLAARWGRLEMVDVLLRHGADPQLSDAEWSTPLAWASRKGHAQVATRLRAAGAR